MGEYTLHIGLRSWGLGENELEAVKTGARLAYKWNRGDEVTFDTVDGPVTLQPEEWEEEIWIDGPF